MSANQKRAAFGIAAATCAVVLLWWVAWCFHTLTGWTAVPIGLTVGGALYGLGSIFIFAAVGVNDDKA